MTRLTLDLANTISSQPHRMLMSYFDGWYHVVVVELPVHLLCGRPMGRAPRRWDKAAVIKASTTPSFSGVWLCDECRARFDTEQRLKSAWQHPLENSNPDEVK